MTLPRGFTITELNNTTVANPICQSNRNTWTAHYTTAQDLQIKVKTPDTTPRIVYGLSQTQLLAIKAAIYDSGAKKRDIQLWRTPQNTEYNFKKGWLDCPSDDPSHPTFPYYSAESVAQTELIRGEGEDGEEGSYVTLRLRKDPTSEMPLSIQHKTTKERLSIKQLDVQELYLITLFRDQDEDGKRAPIAQWMWAFKHAWYVDEHGEPRFVAHPGFVDPCERAFPLKGNYKLEGPVVASEAYDLFVELDDSEREGRPMEGEEGRTDDWEVCDA